MILGLLLTGVTAPGTLLANSYAHLLADEFKEVVAALRKGDVNALAVVLDNTVEINIVGNSDSYSKAQAEALLKDFFAKNQVSSFEMKHQGGDKSLFGIGILTTSGGVYRVSFFLQMKGSSRVLNELRFEKNK